MSDEPNRPPEPTEDDTTETMSDDTENDDEPHRGTEAGADEGRDIRRTLNYALLAGLSLVALIATLQLYFNVSSAINQWINPEFRSLFQAAFNLAVLLLVGGGMAWQVRRLRD